MITEFELHDFKGHREVRLRPRRFTVLVGDNASGKTSVLEALEMLSALGNHRFPRDTADLVRRGAEGVRFRAVGSRGEIP